MANDLAGWPWIIDTEGATVVNPGLLKIQRIRWVAGDEAVITNGAGRVIWHGVVNGEDYSESDWFENCIGILGLVVPTLDAGVLYVYYE